MVKIITDDHFDHIHETEYSDVKITAVQKKELLKVLNGYFLRMIRGAEIYNQIDLKVMQCIHCEGTITRNVMSTMTEEKRNKFDPAITDEDDAPFPLYTVGRARQLLQKVFPSKQITGLQSKADYIATIEYFNWIIYRLVTICLRTLETVKFQDLFTQRKVASFFNPKFYIENYVEIPKSLTECEDLYAACLLSGIEEDEKKDERNPSLLREIPVTENGYFLLNFLLTSGYLYVGKNRNRVSHAQSVLLYSGLKRFFGLYDM